MVFTIVRLIIRFVNRNRKKRFLSRLTVPSRYSVIQRRYFIFKNNPKP